MLWDLVQWYNQATPLITSNWPFGVILTFVQMGFQSVQTYHNSTPKLFVVTGDFESREEISQNPRGLGEIFHGRDWVTVIGTNGVVLQPLIDARFTETVFTFADLYWSLKDLPTYTAHQLLVHFVFKSCDFVTHSRASVCSGLAEGDGLVEDEHHTESHM